MMVFRRPLASLVLLLGLVLPAAAALSDAQAVTLARKTWGTSAYVAKVRAYGDSNWTFQVGFKSPGCAQEVTILGSALNSWDAAFAAVPAAVTAPLSGTVTLTVEAGQSSSGPPVGVIETFAAFVTSFQFLLDEIPVGGKLLVTTDPALPWSLSTVIDTTKIPDGPHVLCGTWTDASGNTAGVHATMLVVKQLASNN